MKNINQKGFSAVVILLTLILVFVIGFVGYYVWSTTRNKDPQQININTESVEKVEEANSENPNTQIFKISEWNIRLNLNNIFTSATYSRTNTENWNKENLPTFESIDITFNENTQGCYVATVVRSTKQNANEEQLTFLNQEQALPSFVKLVDFDNYSYFYAPPDGFGSEECKQSHDIINQELPNIFKSIQKI